MSKKTTSAKAHSKGGKKAKGTKAKSAFGSMAREPQSETLAPPAAPETTPATTEPSVETDQSDGTKAKGKKGKKAKTTCASARKVDAPKTDGKMSGLDAAAKILADAKEPLDCKTIVERAFAQGLWKSDGKTPGATIYSAILREIAKKGTASRFQKAARGKFSAAS